MSCIQKVVVRGLPADGWRGRAVIRRAAKCRSLLAAGSRNNVYSGRARPGAECCILWHSRPGGSRWSGRGLQRSPPAPSIRAPNKSEDTAIRHRQALNSRPRARGVELGGRPGWRKGFPAGLRSSASRGHAGTNLQRSNFSGGSARWKRPSTLEASGVGARSKTVKFSRSFLRQAVGTKSGPRPGQRFAHSRDMLPGPFVEKLLGENRPSDFGRRGRFSVGTLNLEPQRSRGVTPRLPHRGRVSRSAGSAPPAKAGQSARPS